jgi:hypothetical protein
MKYSKIENIIVFIGTWLTIDIIWALCMVYLSGITPREILNFSWGAIIIMNIMPMFMAAVILYMANNDGSEF